MGQIKQLRAGAQASADIHIYPPEIAWVLLVADMKITLTSINALYLRKIQAIHSRYRLLTLMLLVIAHISNIIIALYAIWFTFGFSLKSKNCYISEMSREAIVSLITIVIFDVTEARGIWKWQRTGVLDWKEQHRMACTYLTLEFLGVPASFVAHDATWFFEYPGLGLRKRIFVQLVPPMLFILVTPDTLQAIFHYQHRLWFETGVLNNLRSLWGNNLGRKENSKSADQISYINLSGNI